MVSRSSLVFGAVGGSSVSGGTGGATGGSGTGGVSGRSGAGGAGPSVSGGTGSGVGGGGRGGSGVGGASGAGSSVSGTTGGATGGSGTGDSGTGGASGVSDNASVADTKASLYLLPASTMSLFALPKSREPSSIPSAAFIIASATFVPSVDISAMKALVLSLAIAKVSAYTSPVFIL